MLYLKAALMGPGIVLHEFAHQLFCLISGVRVRKVVYFQMASPAGFVLHEDPEYYRQIFAIVVGPLVVNSCVAVVLVNLALRRASTAADLTGALLALLLAWLGISAGLQAVPSRADAANLFSSSNKHLRRGNPFAILGYPVALIALLFQVARPLGSEVLYTLFLCYLALRGFVGLS